MNYQLGAAFSMTRKGLFLWPEAKHRKQEMLKELVGYIIANGFTTINDFTVAAMNDFDGCYWEIIVGYNGTLERYCRGNYLKRKAKAEARDAGE